MLQKENFVGMGNGGPNLKSDLSSTRFLPFIVLAHRDDDDYHQEGKCCEKWTEKKDVEHDVMMISIKC